jgi:hypothetical protein
MAAGILTINVASDFSRTPGPRHPHEGKFSGEAFREELLKPRFEQAARTGQRLRIELDGTAGYARSFLEEAFGGLIRTGVEPDKLLGIVEIVSRDQPHLVGKIERYIHRAAERR